MPGDHTTEMARVWLNLLTVENPGHRLRCSLSGKKVEKGPEMPPESKETGYFHQSG